MPTKTLSELVEKNVALWMGGFALAAFAAVRSWLPTAEIKTSFLAPLPIGPCVGEGRILRVGRQLAFGAGRLMSGGSPVIIATATLVRREDPR